MNLYAYVGNDPVNMVDPSGESAVNFLYLPGFEYNKIPRAQAHEVAKNVTIASSALSLLTSPFPPVAGKFGTIALISAGVAALTSEKVGLDLGKEAINFAIGAKLKFVSSTGKIIWHKAYEQALINASEAAISKKSSEFVDYLIAPPTQEKSKTSNKGMSGSTYKVCSGIGASEQKKSSESNGC